MQKYKTKKIVKYYLFLIIICFWIFLLFEFDFISSGYKKYFSLPSFSGGDSISWSQNIGLDLISWDVENSFSGVANFSVDKSKLASWVLEEIRNYKGVTVDMIRDSFDQSFDIEMWKFLISEYRKMLKFDDAFYVIRKMVDQKKYLPDWGLYVFLYLNSSEFSDISTVNLSKLELLIKQMADQYLMTAQEKERNNALIDFMKRDIVWFERRVQWLSDPKYDSIKAQIESINQSIKWKKWIPDYYKESLIALALYKQWYTKISQQVSARVLLLDWNYILPYQILAYSHFVMENRDVAKSYINQLIELDVQNSMQYKLMLWIISFNQKKYNESVLFLSDVNSWDWLLDSIRYRLASYYEIQNFWEIKKLYLKLIDVKWVLWDDYLSFFEHFIYDNYFSNSTWKIDRELVIKFLEKCFDVLSDKNICYYWKYWFDLTQDSSSWALEKITYNMVLLSKKMWNDVVYRTLWNLSLRKWDVSQARDFYIQSLSDWSDLKTNRQIKNKLMELESK